MPDRLKLIQSILTSSKPSTSTSKCASPLTHPSGSVSPRSPWRRTLASIEATTSVKPLPDIWFTSFSPLLRRTHEQVVKTASNTNADGQDHHHRAPDERTLKLGKTLRILQPRLPTLLQTPLPQEILSPQITLHLFPSTHPHLPTVTGKVAYLAALWTAPVAWGRVPIVGNVKLEILSERMVKGPSLLSGGRSGGGGGDERLIVRWRTIGKSRAKDMTASETSSAAAASSSTSSPTTGKVQQKQGEEEQQQQQQQPIDKIIRFLSSSARRGSEQSSSGSNAKDSGSAEDEEFTGLFIFTFDEEGRIVSHTIEHVEEDGSDLNSNRDKMKVVGVTDWLLGSMKKKRKGVAADEEGGLAWGYCRSHDDDDDVTTMLGRAGGLQRRREAAAAERRRM